jgi:hypothetical protein
VAVDAPAPAVPLPAEPVEEPDAPEPALPVALAPGERPVGALTEGTEAEGLGTDTGGVGTETGGVATDVGGVGTETGGVGTDGDGGVGTETDGDGTGGGVGTETVGGGGRARASPTVTAKTSAIVTPTERATKGRRWARGRRMYHCATGPPAGACRRRDESPPRPPDHDPGRRMALARWRLRQRRPARIRPTMSAPELQRDDLAATIAARRELGDESEREIVESFLDRVGAAIDARVDARLEQDGRHRAAPSPSRASVPLALGSMGIGIATTGAASGLDHGGALVAIVAWLVIAAINFAHTLGR